MIAAEKHASNVRVFYTLFVVSIPLFSIYASGIPGFTVGDVLLLIFFVFRIAEGLLKKNIAASKNSSPVLMLAIAIPVITIITLFGQTDPDLHNITIRIVRRVFYYLAVVLVSSEWFELPRGKAAIILLGKIGAGYLFLQYIAFMGARVVLHGYISFLPVYHENYALIDYQALYTNAFRPTSFLLEPAHIARFLAIPLVLLLFDDKSKGRFVSAAFITAAILASTSGIGLMLVALIWFMWVMAGVFNGQSIANMPAYYLLIYVLIVGVIFFVFNNDLLDYAWMRITNSDLSNINTAGGARFRGYVQYLQLDEWGKIFGMGYGSTPNTELGTWFTGASYTLYGTGATGFIVCLFMFIVLFLRNNNPSARALCVSLAFLFFVDDCFMSHVAVLYLTFITANWDASVLAEDINEDTVSN